MDRRKPHRRGRHPRRKMTSCGHRRFFKGINLLAERHFNGKTAFVQCASRGACLSSHDRNETENATERGMERAVSPEAASFDPRMALMARRPLDDVTHACKVARLANRSTREARRTAPLMIKTPRTAVLMALMLAVSATHAAPLPPRKPSEFGEKRRNSAAPGALRERIRLRRLATTSTRPSPVLTNASHDWRPWGLRRGPRSPHRTTTRPAFSPCQFESNM